MNTGKTSRTPITPSKAGKRPYQKPTVSFERIFETMALVCGKVNTTQGSCHSNRQTS